MKQNAKVVIRVEYEVDGVRKACYGEIEEKKLEKLKNLENFDVGDENYILMENDGKFPWKDKESVISIEKLILESIVFERPGIKGSSTNNTDTVICS